MARRMNIDTSTAGLWRLDESGGGVAIDLGKTGIDGTNNGTTPIAVSGQPWTYARHFVRASGQYIQVPHNAVLAPSSITLEMWVKFDSLPWAGGLQDWQTMLCKYDGNGYIIDLGDVQDLRFWFNNGSATEIQTRISTFLDNIHWYYFAATYDGTNACIYVNGVLRKKEIHSGILNGGSADLEIGRAATFPNRHFDGNMAEVRISNRAMHPWEIYNIWKASSDPHIGLKP